MIISADAPVLVWLLSERVGQDESMFALGIFSSPDQAKLAAEREPGIRGEPFWEVLSWDGAREAFRADLLCYYNDERIPVEFWVIPFLLNEAEAGTQLLHLPGVLGQLN